MKEFRRLEEADRAGLPDGALRAVHGPLKHPSRTRLLWKRFCNTRAEWRTDDVHGIEGRQAESVGAEEALERAA